MELPNQVVFEKEGYGSQSIDVTVGEPPRNGSTGIVVVENEEKEVVYIEEWKAWRLKK